MIPYYFCIILYEIYTGIFIGYKFYFIVLQLLTYYLEIIVEIWIHIFVKGIFQKDNKIHNIHIYIKFFPFFLS